MPLNFTFKGLDRRTAWLRGILLIASFCGLLASAPLWLDSRTFPLVPIFRTFPILLAPLEQSFFRGHAL